MAVSSVSPCVPMTVIQIVINSSCRFWQIRINVFGSFINLYIHCKPNQFSILGGEPGIIFDVGFPPARFGEEFTQYKWFFWIASFIALLTLFITLNILQSRYGRTWRAIRGNSLAAELSGVHSSWMKILAFTISSALAGLAGAVLRQSQ